MTVVYSRKRLRAQRQPASSSKPAPTTLTQQSSADAASSESAPESPPSRRSKGRRKLLQLHLDAGQSDIAHRKCETCNLVYTPGVPADESVHRGMHRMALRAARLTFRVRPDARMVRMEGEGELEFVWVRKGDAKAGLRQMERLDRFVTERLGEGGAFRGFGSEGVWICVACVRGGVAVGFLYGETVGEVREGVVGKDGVAVVEEKVVKGVFCGVRKIWVADEMRRERIASRMIDIARRFVLYASEILPGQVAFTPTTTQGGLLAISYARRCGRKRILVYT